MSRVLGLSHLSYDLAYSFLRLFLVCVALRFGDLFESALQDT
jgi:hypothetical protein